MDTELSPPLNADVLSANLLLLKDLKEVLGALDEWDIPCLVLKGWAFAAGLYPRPDLRPMEDIDLLIPGDQLDAARRLFAELGFRAEPGKPTEYRRGRTTLDVESGIWYLDRREMKAAWMRAVALEEEKPPIRTLAWEDHFIFMVAHGAVHHVWWDKAAQEDFRLFMDLSLNWGAVIRRVRHCRLVAALAATLRLFDQVPPEALGLTMSPLEKMEAALHHRLLARGAPHEGWGHLLRLWTSPSRPRALAGWLFPDGDFLRRRYGTDNTLLYRFLRPFLLLAAALRCLFALGNKA